MKNIVLLAALLASSVAISAPPFSPNPPTASVTATKDIVVRWNQAEYGLSSEVCLWPDAGDPFGTAFPGTPPLRRINGANAGAAAFTAVKPGSYIVTVISEQNRRGSGTHSIRVP